MIRRRQRSPARGETEPPRAAAAGNGRRVSVPPAPAQVGGDWVYRTLLLSMAAFWWVGIVAPQLVSLAFPQLLAPDMIPKGLNPEVEGSTANWFSAGMLFGAALLLLGSAVERRLRAAGWTVVISWVVLAAAAALVALEELVEFKGGLDALIRRWIDTEFDTILRIPTLGVAIPVLALAVWRSHRAWKVRAPLLLGLGMWASIVVREVFVFPRLYAIPAPTLGGVFEESLELAAAALLGLGAALALWPGPGRRLPPRRVQALLGGSVAAVAVLGGLAVALLFRAPQVDARAYWPEGTFQITLADGESVTQELDATTAPVAEVEVQAIVRGPQDRLGALLWRVMEVDAGTFGPVLREGRILVAAADYLHRKTLDLARPLAPSAGRTLAVQLVADVEPGSFMQIGATRRTPPPRRNLWVNGEPAWPDQSIEITAYTHQGLTLSKLQALWELAANNPRWALLMLDVFLVMSLLLFVPSLLVTVALSEWRAARPPRRVAEGVQGG